MTWPFELTIFQKSSYITYHFSLFQRFIWFLGGLIPCWTTEFFFNTKLYYVLHIWIFYLILTLMADWQLHYMINVMTLTLQSSTIPFYVLKSTYDVILLFEHSIIFQEWSVRKVGQPLFWYIEKHAIKEWKCNRWFECTKFSFYFYTVKVYFKWVNVLVSLHSLKAMCLGPFGAPAPLLLRNGAILVH